jgi:hypothetical protein
MKYLAILLDRVGENIDDVTSEVNRETYEGARKEFAALKAAGIGVEIENVERVRVTKTKMRHSKKTKKSE